MCNNFLRVQIIEKPQISSSASTSGAELWLNLLADQHLIEKLFNTNIQGTLNINQGWCGIEFKKKIRNRN